MTRLRYVSRILSPSLRSTTPGVQSTNPRRVVVRSLATAKTSTSPFAALDTFADRHIGPDDNEAAYMLSKLGYDSMAAFLNAAIPSGIRVDPSSITNSTIPSLSESELILRARELGRVNKMHRSYIGMGYHNVVVPPVILRNVRSQFIFLAV
jgi:glycine dehydrogenase